MMKLVRIQSDPNGPSQTWIKNAETGETIHGVKAIDIHIGIMELPVATMEIFTEFDGVAKPVWKPAFDRAGRCESCKWWQGANKEYWGRCHLLSDEKTDEDIDGAELVRLAVDRISALASSVAHHGYPSEVRTDAKFGCVQWQPKEGD